MLVFFFSPSFKNLKQAGGLVHMSSEAGHQDSFMRGHVHCVPTILESEFTMPTVAE